MKNSKTQIVATIGPTSINYAIMKKMAQAGMDIVRINLSHAVRPDMEQIVENVKQLKKETGIKLSLMLDTRGPEIRVKTFEQGRVEIKKGQQMFIKREIAGALVFFVITIVQMLISFVAEKGSSRDNMMSCVNCFIKGDCTYRKSGGVCPKGTSLSENGKYCVK